MRAILPPLKVALAASAVAALVVGAQAHGGGDRPAEPEAGAVERVDWSAWTAASAVSEAQPHAEATEAEIDVVDARWMALTMWGEARGGGEAAMRAVGHVIDNRRRAGLHGAYVTDTVSHAFQFSCWNPGDPNLEAMMNVDSLPATSEDHRRWLVAKAVAQEILAGRSDDPTGGALFYHSVDVAPAWSRGVAPVRRIGGHLFFLTAARA